MNARHLTHSTNVVLVVVAGMTAAHLWMPVRAGTSVAPRAAFVAIVAAAGALAGWRERRALEEERDAPVARPALWPAGGALLALAAAGLTWRIVHG